MEFQHPPLLRMPIQWTIQGYNTQHRSKEREFYLAQGFCADVSHIIGGWYQLKGYGSIFNTFLDEMVMDIDMLGFAVIDWVRSWKVVGHYGCR